MHKPINWLARALLLICCIIITLTYSNRLPVFAQSNETEWSKPILLFEAEDGTIFTPFAIADPTGAVHVFWRFVSSEGVELIYYTVWNGTAWSIPIDIVADSTVVGPSAAVDQYGTIHLVWQGPNNQLMYSHAAADKATSARSWSVPEIIDETNPFAQISTYPNGGVHLIYPREESAGLMHQMLDPGRGYWSLSSSVSFTSRPDSSANFARLAIDESGTLHTAWTEFQWPGSWPPVALLYSHSKDGGKTWSAPYELAGEGYNQVNIAANDNLVYAIWNGMAGIHGRYYRWSADRGETWSDTMMFNTAGDKGSTGPPPLTVDSTGGIHALMTDGGCLLYTNLKNSRWSHPNCISQSLGIPTFIEEPSMTISTGNQLHAVFWSDRQELWYTTKILAVPEAEPVSFTARTRESPTPQQLDNVLSQTEHSESVATPTRMALANTNRSAAAEDTYEKTNPGFVILLGIAPVFIILSAILGVNLFVRYRH